MADIIPLSIVRKEYNSFYSGNPNHKKANLFERSNNQDGPLFK